MPALRRRMDPPIGCPFQGSRSGADPEKQLGGLPLRVRGLARATVHHRGTSRGRPCGQTDVLACPRDVPGFLRADRAWREETSMKEDRSSPLLGDALPGLARSDAPASSAIPSGVSVRDFIRSSTEDLTEEPEASKFSFRRTGGARLSERTVSRHGSRKDRIDLGGGPLHPGMISTPEARGTGDVVRRTPRSALLES